MNISDTYMLFNDFYTYMGSFYVKKGSRIQCFKDTVLYILYAGSYIYTCRHRRNSINYNTIKGCIVKLLDS